MKRFVLMSCMVVALMAVCLFSNTNTVYGDCSGPVASSCSGPVASSCSGSEQTLLAGVRERRAARWDAFANRPRLLSRLVAPKASSCSSSSAVSYGCTGSQSYGCTGSGPVSPYSSPVVPYAAPAVECPDCPQVGSASYGNASTYFTGYVDSEITTTKYYLPETTATELVVPAAAPAAASPDCSNGFCPLNPVKKTLNLLKPKTSSFPVPQQPTPDAAVEPAPATKEEVIDRLEAPGDITHLVMVKPPVTRSFFE